MKNNQEFIENLFNNLVDDLATKWQETVDGLTKEQRKQKLKELDLKTLQFIKMAPQELILYRDDVGNNLGHYTAIFELKQSTKLLYKYQSLASQKNFEGSTIKTYAHANNIKLKKF